jgi:aminomethyltransferase
MRWKDWAGYYAVCAYDTYPDREYFALRHAAAMIDVTPLFKYDVRGPDAARFLAHVMARNIEKVEIGQVAYVCWCDEEGKLLDDGTVSRLDATDFRVTAAEPNLAWLSRNARGFDVSIADRSAQIAVLSLQGPRSREILDQASGGAASPLRFFRLARARVGGASAIITRTGYTGDLGYEIWVENADALALWDALVEAGRRFGM